MSNIYFTFYLFAKTKSFHFGLVIEPKPTELIDVGSTELERKLSKLKNSSNILDQLKARREHCIENLLVGNIDLHDSTNGDEIHLDEDIESNTRRDILRYIQPEQPINLGELVTIINHDYLDSEKSEPAQQPDDTN